MYAARLSFGMPLLTIRLLLDENGAEMHTVVLYKYLNLS